MPWGLIEFRGMRNSKKWFTRFWAVLLLVEASNALSPGFQNAATNGGGYALPQGPSSVFGNPAAVVQPRRSSGEGGVSEVGTEQPIPWFAWVFPAGREASVGLGLVETDPGAVDEHLVHITGVSRLFLGTWIGGRASMQKLPEETSMDFSVGGMHRVGPHLGLGWSADRVTESLQSTNCPGCDRRGFGAGISWFFDREERYALFADLHTEDRLLRSSRDYSPLAGARIELGSQRNLQMLFSVRRSDFHREGATSLSAGVGLQQTFLSTLIHANYAMTALPVRQRDGAGPWHQVSVGLVWDAFEDRTEPMPFVRSTVAQLSPGGVDGLPRGLDFLLRVVENTGKLEDWSLVVYTAPQGLQPEQLVRRFTGKGMPPANVYWSGDDMAGYPCKPGIYAYRLIVADQAGNLSWTEWQHLELR